MAQKLFTAEEAARMLGITPDELNTLRERREVFGIRDGGGWKYKDQEIQRVLQERESGGDDGESLLMGVEDTGTGTGDSVLLSEVALGEPGSSLSGTVIGKTGDKRSPSDSDLMSAEDLHFDEGSSILASSKVDALAGDSRKSKPDSDVKSDSDVTLVPDTSDSGVKLVAREEVEGSDDLSNTVELELSDLAMDSSSDMPLELGSGIGSDIHIAAAEPAQKPGSDLTLDSDALGGVVDVLGLVDSKIPLEEPRKKGSGTGSSGSGGTGGSAIELGVGEFEDDDLVLGSHTGSDINDSGISLADPADSGLSLEQPLQLGGDDMVDDSGFGGQLTADDEFMLTPAVEMGEEELDESGSQVIALDSEADFDDSAATLLGEGMPQTGGMFEDDSGAQPIGPLGAAAMGGMAGTGAMLAPTQMVVAREAPYSVWNIISLGACFFLLSLTGMMMWDLLRNMWSWDAPYAVNSTLMDSLLSMFEG